MAPAPAGFGSRHCCLDTGQALPDFPRPQRLSAVDQRTDDRRLPRRCRRGSWCLGGDRDDQTGVGRICRQQAKHLVPRFGRRTEESLEKRSRPWLRRERRQCRSKRRGGTRHDPRQCCKLANSLPQSAGPEVTVGKEIARSGGTRIPLPRREEKLLGGIAAALDLGHRSCNQEWLGIEGLSERGGAHRPSGLLRHLSPGRSRAANRAHGILAKHGGVAAPHSIRGNRPLVGRKGDDGDPQRFKSQEGCERDDDKPPRRRQTLRRQRPAPAAARS